MEAGTVFNRSLPDNEYRRPVKYYSQIDDNILGEGVKDPYANSDLDNKTLKSQVEFVTLKIQR